MSRSDLKQGTNQVDIIFNKPGIAIEDPITYEITYTQGESFTVRGNFIILSPSEIVKRQQVQDASRYKVNIDDTEQNRTINNTFTATINNKVYNVIGMPKIPQFNDAWVNVYLAEKGV